MASDSHRRVVILAGAAQGIGRAIALRLAKDGFDLGLFDLPRCRDLLEGLAAEIRKERDVRVLTVYGDVSVEDDVKGLVDTVAQELGGVYAMIANAGTCTVAPFLDTPAEMLDNLLNVNVKGVFFCYKYAAKRMIEQGKGGRIIGASSVVGFIGAANQPAYSATKFAVRGLTQSAAMDFGKYGITVNAYAPGAIHTPLMHKMDEMHTALTGEPMGSYSGGFKNATGKYGEPEDIAKLVSFLVSDDSSFVTGQTYIADGGVFFT